MLGSKKGKPNHAKKQQKLLCKYKRIITILILTL